MTAVGDGGWSFIRTTGGDGDRSSVSGGVATVSGEPETCMSSPSGGEDEIDGRDRGDADAAAGDSPLSRELRRAMV